MRIWQLKIENLPIINNGPGLKNVCFSLNIQNRKNDMYLFIFSQKYQNIDKYAKKSFWNFGADSLDCGPILDNLEINP